MIVYPCQSLCGLNGLHLRILDCGHASSAREWVGNVVSPSYSRLYYICGEILTLPQRKAAPLK